MHLASFYRLVFWNSKYLINVDANAGGTESQSLLEAKLKGFVWKFILTSIKRLKCKLTAITNFTGVQASGLIIDHLLRQCCFVLSEIIGAPSSGNFND